MVPTYDVFIEPVLRFLATQSAGVKARLAHEAAAEALELTDEERAEMLPSGVQLVYKNRAGWAHDRLKRAGLSSSPSRGTWRLTDKGRQYAASHGGPLQPEEVERLATGFTHVKLGSKVGAAPKIASAHSPSPPPAKEEEIRIVSATISPDDRLETALSEIRESVATDMLELISNSTPAFFEQLVLDLLHAMGYGASRRDVQRVGGSSDAGIDGIISLDRLGLEKVYVQAKRWQGTIGRPEVQGFYGALAGQRATKGVFLTTSQFTKQAISFASSVERIVLVDGEELAHLMIEHGVGIQRRKVLVPRIDMDYFE